MEENTEPTKDWKVLLKIVLLFTVPILAMWLLKVLISR